MAQKLKYFVYIVRCKDNSLYTGITNNLEQRINQHNFSKLGAKAIKGKLPVKLEYFEEYNTKSRALKREYEIKSWRKEDKEQLLKNWIPSSASAKG